MLHGNYTKKMPTFKIYVPKDYKRKDDKYPVSIRVTQDRKHAYLKTDFYVVAQQQNKNFEIKDKTLLKLLLEKMEKCEDVIVRGLGNDVSNYSAKDIVEFIKKKQNEVSCIDFIAFARKHISKLFEAGREKRAKHIQTTINALVDFSGQELNIVKVTSKFLEKFEEFLRSERTIVRVNQFGREVTTKRKPLTDTGVHDYMADIRAVFNEAIDFYNDDELGDPVIKHYPFRKFEVVKPNPPKKRNIYFENIRKIMNLENGLRRQELARDVFMLSFFLVGMNTVDMFNVPYSSRKNGRITYQRSKTKDRREDNAEISIKIESEAERLMKKYADPGKVRLFSFYKLYSDSSVFNGAVNNGFKRVVQEVNESIKNEIKEAKNKQEKEKLRGFLIPEDTKAYSVRHSWATIARNVLNISKDDIDLCLNHVNEAHKMADVYIDKDFTRIDQANRRMIDLLFQIGD